MEFLYNQFITLLLFSESNGLSPDSTSSRLFAICSFDELIICLITTNDAIRCFSLFCSSFCNRKGKILSQKRSA